MKPREREKKTRGRQIQLPETVMKNYCENMFSERVQMKLSWNPQAVGPRGWIFQSGEALEVCCCYSAAAAAALPFN